ncbi:phage protein [Clostridioides difficile]|uniref:Uncharacterized protein n=2 Tax=root TaxID=1 RepID=A0A3G1E3D2_9CAUD|nr:phage protein [Clostridioides difficile]YP_009830866.1 protein [Clostridium phage CDKM9]ANT45138.1 hypothetical protein CDHM9_70 [Clostridium phage CDKM9]AXU80866.1 hypothetical protein CDIF29688_03573 [Clostridioides difficile]EIS9082902.1 hypothetical protein [Clostridioides difficile]EIS9607214.1 hypothetical protein [Clostridioides difficile]EIS9783777.1 hypothetical protein [Clostridioides difficile]
MNTLIYKYIVNEHRDEADELDRDYGEFKIFNGGKCFGGCGRNFYTLAKFKKMIVTCPHCGKKYQIKLFKNGKVNMRVIE